MESVYHYTQDLGLDLLLFFLLFYQEQVLVSMWHHMTCVLRRLIGGSDAMDMSNDWQVFHYISHKIHCMTSEEKRKRERERERSVREISENCM